MSTTFKSAESTDIQAVPPYSLYSAYSLLAINADISKKDWGLGVRRTLDYRQVGILSCQCICDRVCIGPNCRDSRTAKWFNIFIYSFYCAKQYC